MTNKTKTIEDRTKPLVWNGIEYLESPKEAEIIIKNQPQESEWNFLNDGGLDSHRSLYWNCTKQEDDVNIRAYRERIFRYLANMKRRGDSFAKRNRFFWEKMDYYLEKPYRKPLLLSDPRLVNTIPEEFIPQDVDSTKLRDIGDYFVSLRLSGPAKGRLTKRIKQSNPGQPLEEVDGNYQLKNRDFFWGFIRLPLELVNLNMSSDIKLHNRELKREDYENLIKIVKYAYSLYKQEKNLGEDKK